jgi:hypothetical protein
MVPKFSSAVEIREICSLHRYLAKRPLRGDMDARSVFPETRVEVVVYCSFHNLDRGFIIFIWNPINYGFYTKW